MAAELKLTDWYTWRRVQENATIPTVSDSDATDEPDFLSRPDVQVPVIMYMVGALQRFENMSHAEISQIAGEIALLGQTGIDYTDSTQKYTLRFLPDETFSGLQLLAIMYVGYQLLNPSLDTGLPFADPYRQAQSMYRADM